MPWTRKPFLAAAIFTAALAPAAFADPAGQTTLDETIQIAPGGGFQALVAGPGEDYTVRRLGVRARDNRVNRRRSLLFFGQLTDPQIADEMTPPRLDFTDPAGAPVQDGFRPQETMGTQTFDQIIRNVNLNRTSPVEPGRGNRGQLALAINTGDLADNAQLNEVQWFREVLRGGLVDPFSGKPIGPNNPCGSADAQETAQLNADVAARRYTGLQDYDEYRGVRADRVSGFWDPDEAPPAGGAYQDFPRYANLLERAQQPFTAEGLAVPSYISRGNHDGLVTGNASPSFPIAAALITGCQKIYPSDSFDPSTLSGLSDEEVLARFSDPTFQAQALAGARLVPPDPDRRFVAPTEYKDLFTGQDDGHGYDFVSRAQERRSDDNAQYYAWTPRRGIRFISLDTVADGGGQNGNIDHPQYRWLRRQIDRNSATEVRRGRVRNDRGRDNLIVLFGHHGISTLTNTNSDEDLDECTQPNQAGCDRDPRRSTPLHRGSAGRKSIRNLLLKHPGVIAYVSGHTHENTVTPYRRGRTGFWEINTASHVDFPQQSRLIEIMANGNGSLSIFGTILNSAAPIAPPAPGDATAFTNEQLASVSRSLAANDPQGKVPGNPPYDSGLGDAEDRNVELLLRDPRR